MALAEGEGFPAWGPDQVLDVRGLCCPLPVLRTQQAMQKLDTGRVLEVVATDPGSKKDIPVWAEITGHRLLGLEERQDGFHFFLQKSSR